jgi:phosphoribosylanthranilate isomerase
MPRTRVKICGITRPEDAVRAAELGADSIGLNLFRGPRQITDEVFTQIYWVLRDEDSPVKRHVDLISLCAASRDPHSTSVAWQDVPYTMDAYQIYADDYDAISNSPLLFNRWWMVSRISSRDSVAKMVVAVVMHKWKPAAILLDAASPDKLGGTGQTFNWHWIAEAREAGELNGLPPVILAGGLTPDNVA